MSDALSALRLSGLAGLIAGRQPSGQPKLPATSTTREVVTQIDPVLMSRPVTGGAPAQVEWTDAVAGVAVDDVIGVVQEGYARRVAVALLTPKTITQRSSGEDVATVNGKTLSVGGTVSLDSGDVGALPDDTTVGDLGGVSTNHLHQLNTVTEVANTSAVAAATNVTSYSAAADNALRTQYNNLRASVVALIAAHNDLSGHYTGSAT